MARRRGLPAACLLMVLAGSLAERAPLSREAAPQVAVKVTPLKEVVVRDAQGKERIELLPASATRPGDTLVYRISYTNTGTAPAHNARVVDPIPAGTEVVDTSLQTTSQNAQGPEVQKEGANDKPAWWWTPTHVDLRDEKAVMFATELQPGTYEFKYTIRASLPGTFLTLPVTAYQMYFPEVWGRGAGGEFVVTE